MVIPAPQPRSPGGTAQPQRDGPSPPFPTPGAAVQPAARRDVPPPFPARSFQARADARAALPGLPALRPPFAALPARAQARLPAPTPPFPAAGVQAATAAAAPADVPLPPLNLKGGGGGNGGGGDEKGGGGKKGDDEKLPGPIRRTRKKAAVRAALTGFQVTWAPHPNAAGNYISFQIDVVATFNARVDPERIEYRQYTWDRCSIQAGTDPGNIQFRDGAANGRLDRYTVDDETGDVVSDGSLTFQDNPGYTPAYLLDATTDLHYTFGAWWQIKLDGARVLTTDWLFGTVSGAHPRAYVPGAAQVATWDFLNARWNNPGTLVHARPALPAGYPNPPVR